MVTTLLAFLSIVCVLSDSIFDQSIVSVTDQLCMWVVFGAWMVNVVCRQSRLVWRRLAVLLCNIAIASSCTASTVTCLSACLGGRSCDRPESLLLRCTCFMLVVIILARQIVGVARLAQLASTAGRGRSDAQPTDAPEEEGAIRDARDPLDSDNTQGQEEGDDGELCVICLEVILHTHRCALPCKHVYHAECIERWIGIRRKCPVCNSWLQLVPDS